MVTAVLFDTCVLIDYLNGLPAAKRALEAPGRHLISRINWLEVLCGVRPDDMVQVRTFLGSFVIVELDAAVSERALVLRKEYRLKLPDLLIYASAVAHDATLLTTNTRDFATGMPGILVPYGAS